MPFKYKASCRHDIPKMPRRVTNWPNYEAGLQRRGDLTFWLDETALTGVRLYEIGSALYLDLPDLT